MNKYGEYHSSRNSLLVLPGLHLTHFEEVGTVVPVHD
jgi:hypothetical protein